MEIAILKVQPQAHLWLLNLWRILRPSHREDPRVCYGSWQGWYSPQHSSMSIACRNLGLGNWLYLVFVRIGYQGVIF